MLSLNKIYTIFHSLGFGFLGEIISEKFILWKKREVSFDLEHDEYCRKISKLPNYYNNIDGNTGEANKIFNPKKQYTGNILNTTFRSTLIFNTPQFSNNDKNNYDADLAFLCAIEFASTLILKFPNLLIDLIRFNIKISIALISDTFIYGYVGTPTSSISQFLYSKKIKNIQEYLVSYYTIYIIKNKEHFSEIPVIITPEVYKELNIDLQRLVFPYDVTSDSIYYKLFYTEVNGNNEEDEEAIFLEEFNINRILAMREQTGILANSDFDELIDLLFSTNHLSQGVNSTLQSLTKLLYHNYLLCDFDKVLEILEDIFYIISGSYNSTDKDFYFKMKQMKDKIQQFKIQQ